MQDTPSADPRDQAILAALRDAATLATYVVDLGGHLEEAGPRDLVADFGGRRITVRLG